MGSDDLASFSKPSAIGQHDRSHARGHYPKDFAAVYAHVMIGTFGETRFGDAKLAPHKFQVGLLVKSIPAQPVPRRPRFQTSRYRQARRAPSRSHSEAVVGVERDLLPVHAARCWRCRGISRRGLRGSSGQSPRSFARPTLRGRIRRACGARRRQSRVPPPNGSRTNTPNRKTANVVFKLEAVSAGTCR